LLQDLSRKCQTRVFLVEMPIRIKSYVVRKDDWYTICINEALSPDARMKAYRHELDHIEQGDFDSDESTGLIEIRAHEKDRKER